MNKISTSSVSDITKSTAIIYGKLEEKTDPIFAVAFCLREGSYR
jgi:hypothetical protein